MSEPDFSTFTAESLADPSVDAVTLGRLAATRPDLWPAILNHPNIYPDLAQWLAPRVPQGQMRPAAPTEPAHEVQPTQHLASEPVTPEIPEQASAQGFGPSQPQAQPFGAAQQPQPFGAAQQQQGQQAFTQPLHQPQSFGPAQSQQPQQAFAQPLHQPQAFGPAQPQAYRALTGAEWAAQFGQINGRGPTMADYQAAVAAGQVIPDGQSASGTSAGSTGWMTKAPFAMVGAALIAILSLFLPAASIFGTNYTFFEAGSESGEGVILIVLMLLTIGGAVTAFLTRKPWARITAGVIGIISALIGAFDAFGTMSNLSALGVSSGFGLVLLGIASVALLAASVITVLPKAQLIRA